MKLLLDTHSFLWFISGNSRLSKTARGLIEDPNNQPLLSMASLWEMAIKVSIGRLMLEKPFGELIPDQMYINGIGLLDIRMEHVKAVVPMEFYHRDPFDRLLIAQAQVENIPIVGTDAAFEAYNIQLLW